MAIEKHRRQGQDGLGRLSQRTLWRCPVEELRRQDWQAAGGKVTTRCPSIRSRRASIPRPGRSSPDDPDAYVVIDYPETYAKLGAALVRTGKFDAKKLFVADAMSFARSPDNIPAEALEGAYGVAGGSPRGTGRLQALRQALGGGRRRRERLRTANSFDSAILCFLAAVAGRFDRSRRDPRQDPIGDAGRRAAIHYRESRPRR